MVIFLWEEIWMSRLTYSTPRLFIGNTEFLSFSSISYKNSGNNQVTSLQISLKDPELDGAALMGKKVVFYLNHGSEDTVPFFIGRVRQFQPSDSSLTITARDVLTFLTGNESPSVNMTETVNYDGFTLAQFLHDYISTNINKKETLIGLDMLNETDPTVTLTGVRGKNMSPLKVVTDKLPKKTSNLEDIREYRILLRNDATTSHITFAKEQSTEDAAIGFSFNDGIQKMSYKKRLTPNYFTVNVGESVMEYVDNSLPTGVVSGKLPTTKFDYPDEAKEEAYITTRVEENKKEITLTTSKGHYLDIGNVIYVFTPNHPEISGKHRIKAKSIKAGGTDMLCTLTLNKEVPIVSDYI